MIKKTSFCVVKLMGKKKKMNNKLNSSLHSLMMINSSPARRSMDEGHFQGL